MSFTSIKMVNPMVNKSISLACFLLLSIVCVVMLELLLTLLHQFLANFSILVKSGDKQNAISPH